MKVGVEMKNEDIKFYAGELLKKLSKKYEKLEAFLFYNNEFEQYELVINSIYEENDEFLELLNQLMFSEIISKKLFLYAYFTDNFEEIKRLKDNDVYRYDKTEILKNISPEIKLLFEGTTPDVDYIIPLNKQTSIKLMKIQENGCEEKYELGGEYNGIVNNRYNIKEFSNDN